MTTLASSRVASLAVAGLLCAMPASAQEVIVFASFDDGRRWLESENWWGEEKRGEQLQVPNALITGISQRWRHNAGDLPVAQKKEAFYRFMLPLIVHANDMVLDRRRRLTEAKAVVKRGEPLADDDLQQVRDGAVLMRVLSRDEADALTANDKQLPAVLDELLHKVDIVPNGLALGQAAYESGYGTSRFAVEGNALFGQWTYGGTGLKPEQQREHLGDYGIAAFDWPFDSVRGYFINLMSHPAYEDFRRLRAQFRAEGKALTSLDLADGLIKYSERGQEYVDTLKSMIRVNKLDIADGAAFRDEPTRFIIGAEDQAKADELRRRIDEMRTSGELEKIIARMRLD